jgi:hypothetical protein
LIPSFARIKKLTVGLTLGSVVALSAVGAAFADTSDFTQSVTGGSLSATVVTDPTFGAVVYSYTSETSDGTLAIQVDDSRGTGAGWHLTLSSSTLAYTGSHPTQAALAATNVSIQSAAAPVSVAGEDTTGVTVPTGIPGTLDVPRTFLTAASDAGEGTYTQDVTIRVTLPAQTATGDYNGTLTLTEVSGPSA